MPNDGLIRFRAMFNIERVMLTSPKAIAEVLVTKAYEFTKPSYFQYTLGRLLGIGVLLAEGDAHKVQRKNLMPAFAFRHIKDLYPVMWHKAREITDAMAGEIQRGAAGEAGEEKQKGAAVLEVGEWASRVTLDIIGVAGLGRDFGATRNPENELAKLYTKVFSSILSGAGLGRDYGVNQDPERKEAKKTFASNPALELVKLTVGDKLASFLPIKTNFEVFEARKAIRTVCLDLIQDRKQKLARGDETGGAGHPVRSHQIGHLQRRELGGPGHDLPGCRPRDHGVGHDVGRVPALPVAEIQARLRAEVRTHLPSLSDPDARDVTAADIDRMPYLNAFCSELLRYNSPVTITLHVPHRRHDHPGPLHPQGHADRRAHARHQQIRGPLGAGRSHLQPGALDAHGQGRPVGRLGRRCFQQLRLHDLPARPADVHRHQLRQVRVRYTARGMGGSYGVPPARPEGHGREQHQGPEQPHHQAQDHVRDGPRSGRLVGYFGWALAGALKKAVLLCHVALPKQYM